MANDTIAAIVAAARARLVALGVNVHINHVAIPHDLFNRRGIVLEDMNSVALIDDIVDRTYPGADRATLHGVVDEYAGWAQIVVYN